jgi:hypothetical protein
MYRTGPRADACKTPPASKPIRCTNPCQTTSTCNPCCLYYSPGTPTPGNHPTPTHTVVEAIDVQGVSSAPAKHNSLSEIEIRVSFPFIYSVVGTRSSTKLEWNSRCKRCRSDCPVWKFKVLAIPWLLNSVFWILFVFLLCWLTKVTRILVGWDMDPLNLVWDEKLLFHATAFRVQIQLTNLDWDKLSLNDHIGDELMSFSERFGW